MKLQALGLVGALTLAGATALAAPMIGPPPPPPPEPTVLPAPAPPPVAAPTPAPRAPGAPAPSWLRAEKPAAKSSLATQRTPSPLRVGGMLLLVATLGGAAYYARRRNRPLGRVTAKAELKVLGTTRVGAKASAVIVEVAGKRLLLGVTDQAVSTLAWLDDEANAAVAEPHEDSRVEKRAERASAPDDLAAAGPSGFLRLLRNAVGTKAAEPVAAVDEIVRTTRDEVRLSSRRERAVEPRREAAEPDDSAPFEGQVMGLMKRRRELP